MKQKLLLLFICLKDVQELVEIMYGFIYIIKGDVYVFMFVKARGFNLVVKIELMVGHWLVILVDCVMM